MKNNINKLFLFLFLVSIGSTASRSLDEGWSKKQPDIRTVRGTLFLIYVDGFPGEIVGSNTRVLFVISNREPNLEDLRKGEYVIECGEKLFLFLDLDILRFLNKSFGFEEGIFLSLMDFFSIQDNLNYFFLNDLDTIEYDEVKFRAFREFEQPALVFEIKGYTYNEIFMNRIKVMPEEKDITIAILFNEAKLEEVQKLVGNGY